jgi:hypothetical protein
VQKAGGSLISNPLASSSAAQDLYTLQSQVPLSIRLLLIQLHCLLQFFLCKCRLHSPSVLPSYCRPTANTSVGAVIKNRNRPSLVIRPFVGFVTMGCQIIIDPVLVYNGCSQAFEKLKITGQKTAGSLLVLSWRLTVLQGFWNEWERWFFGPDFCFQKTGIHGSLILK